MNSARIHDSPGIIAHTHACVHAHTHTFLWPTARDGKTVFVIRPFWYELLEPLSICSSVHKLFQSIQCLSKTLLLCFPPSSLSSFPLSSLPSSLSSFLQSDGWKSAVCQTMCLSSWRNEKTKETRQDHSLRAPHALSIHRY